MMKEQESMSESEGRVSVVPAIREIAATKSAVHEIIAGVAASRPAAIALRQAHRTLSYGDLDAHARALAGTLARRGVEAGSVVAVCLDRSIEQIVALLA